MLETASRNNRQASKRLAIKVQAPDKLLLMANIRIAACCHLDCDSYLLGDEYPVTASKDSSAEQAERNCARPTFARGSRQGW